MDSASELRIQALHPALAAKLRLVDAAFTAVEPGDDLDVAQGFRSWEKQQELWRIGRDSTGNIIDSSVVVTHARPGYSWHEYGMAGDCVPRSLLMTPGWNPNSPLWKLLTQLGKAHGLVCGSCWQHQDLPHLQLTGRFPVSPSDEVRQLFRDGGLQAVWDAAEIS